METTFSVWGAFHPHGHVETHIQPELRCLVVSVMMMPTYERLWWWAIVGLIAASSLTSTTAAATTRPPADHEVMSNPGLHALRYSLSAGLPSRLHDTCATNRSTTEDTASARLSRDEHMAWVMDTLGQMDAWDLAGDTFSVIFYVYCRESVRCVIDTIECRDPLAKRLGLAGKFLS